MLGCGEGCLLFYFYVIGLSYQCVFKVFFVFVYVQCYAGVVGQVGFVKIQVQVIFCFEGYWGIDGIFGNIGLCQIGVIVFIEGINFVEVGFVIDVFVNILIVWNLLVVRVVCQVKFCKFSSDQYIVYCFLLWKVVVKVEVIVV